MQILKKSTLYNSTYMANTSRVNASEPLIIRYEKIQIPFFSSQDLTTYIHYCVAVTFILQQCKKEARHRRTLESLL